MAPVFLGAEDHPPRYRRPKCLTGSAITLVRLAQFFQIGANPRGRHARVADPSGVECQRDGSDQGQRMKAGDGALTRGLEPCPVTGCQPLASRAAKLVSIDRHVPDRGLTNFKAAHEYEAGQAHRPTAGTRQQRADPHTIGLLPAGPAFAQGIFARMGGDCLAGSSRDDQSPVPVLPGCAIVFSAEVLQSINVKPTLKSPHLIVRKT